MFVVYLSFSPSGDTIPLTDRRILALRWWFIFSDEDGGSDGDGDIHADVYKAKHDDDVTMRMRRKTLVR